MHEALKPRQQPVHRRWWFTYRSDLRGPAYWVNYILAEPRDAAYAVPRRVACRLLGWHNHSCDGRGDHRRRTPEE